MPEKLKSWKHFFPFLKEKFIQGILLLMAFVEGRRTRALTSVDKVLLFRFGGIGDMILITPVIKALENNYPNAGVYVVCSDKIKAEFLMRYPNVKEVKAFDLYSIDTRTILKGKPRKEFLRMLRYIRRNKFDLLINLHIPALIDWWAVELILILLSGAKIKAGINPLFLGTYSFYHFWVSEERKANMHYTELFNFLLKVIGIEGDIHTSFPLLEEDKTSLQLLLKNYDIKLTSPLACLHPGGYRLSLESKLWSVSNFKELASRLIRYGFKVVVIGNKDEEKLGRAICEGIPCINLAGKLNIFQAAALIQTSDLFIGNDSGPLHIAVAVGTKAVGICGRPDAEPEYYKYPKDNIYVIVRHSPELIGVDEVFSKALELFFK